MPIHRKHQPARNSSSVLITKLHVAALPGQSLEVSRLLWPYTIQACFLLIAYMPPSCFQARFSKSILLGQFIFWGLVFFFFSVWFGFFFFPFFFYSYAVNLSDYLSEHKQANYVLLFLLLSAAYILWMCLCLTFSTMIFKNLLQWWTPKLIRKGAVPTPILSSSPVFRKDS